MIYKDTPDYMGRLMTDRERDIQESFERVVTDLGLTPYEHGYLTAYRKIGALTYEVEKFVDAETVNYEVIVYRRGGDEVHFKSGFTTIDAAVSNMYKAVPAPN